MPPRGSHTSVLSLIWLLIRMDSSFFESRFSLHFTRLTKLGTWPVSLWNASQKKWYTVYQIVLLLFTFSAIILQMVDLYMYRRNFRKITYNLCTSVIVISICLKMILLYQRKEILDDLRWRLWKDTLRFNSEEDTAILDVAYGHLSYMKKWFYTAAFIFLPAWIVVSYFSYLWGPRELAFSGYLPMDTSNNLTYIPALFYQSVCAIYIISLVIEADLAMFSIALQIGAQYEILIKNMLKLNEVFSDGDEGNEGRDLQGKKIAMRREVNEYLKAETAKNLIKSFVSRQVEIFEYITTFEYIYNRCMFLQIFGGSFLILMNGLELTMLAHEISAKLCYQTGYLALIMIDILFVCYHLSELTTQCCNVGDAAYKVFWYKMEPGIRRSLCMIIRRSQKPPKITSGKLFLMNLRTYLEMLKNIYSWLMLFRQLELK